MGVPPLSILRVIYAPYEPDVCVCWVFIQGVDYMATERAKSLHRKSFGFWEL